MSERVSREMPSSATRPGRPATGRTSRSWRAPVLIGTLALVVLLLLAYAVPSVLAARSLTTVVRHALSSSPTSLDLAYEDVTFPSQGGEVTLSGWWLPGTGPQTVVLVHGVDSVRDDLGVGFLPLAASLVDLGYNVLMFDLGGHGESTDARFVLGGREWRDVLGAVDYLGSRGVAPDQIALAGFSTGAAATLAAAVREPAIGAVVADGVWPDPVELLARQLPEAGGLPPFYAPGVALAVRVLYGHNLLEAVPVRDLETLIAAGRPVYLIHEAEDRYTSLTQAQPLMDLAEGAPTVTSWIADGAPHVHAYAIHPEEYVQRLTTFLEASLGRPEAS